MALPNVSVVQDRSTALQFGRQFNRGTNATTFKSVPNAGQALLYVLDLTEEDVDAQFKPITASGLVGSAGNAITRAAKQYTDEKITALIDGAPDFLDTLKELADAINDDPDYFLTIRSRIAGVSGVLQSQQIATSGFLLNAIVAVSGALESQIQAASGHIADNVEAVSGVLNAKINTDFDLAQTNLQSASGVITTLIATNSTADQTQRQAVSGVLSTLVANNAVAAQTQTQATSGVLNARIDSIDAVNDQDLHNVSGVLNTLIQGNALGISTNGLQIVATASAAQTQTQASSGVLNARIDSIDAVNDQDLHNVSGVLNTLIQGNALGISTNGLQIVATASAAQVQTQASSGVLNARIDSIDAVNDQDLHNVSGVLNTLIQGNALGISTNGLQIVATASAAQVQTQATSGVLNTRIDSIDAVNDQDLHNVSGVLNTAIQTNATAIVTTADNAQSRLQTASGVITTLIAANATADQSQREAISGALNAAKANLAGAIFTGNLDVAKSFPDLGLKSNDEKRLLFSDAGGGGTAAIKHVSSTLDFFAGGIAAGNKELVVEGGAVDVINSLKIGGVAVTADAAELNQLDGTTITAFAKTLLDDADAGATKTTLSLQNVSNTSDADKPISTLQQAGLDLKASLTGANFTGDLTLKKPDGSAVALKLSRIDDPDMNTSFKIQPTYVNIDKEALVVIAGSDPIIYFDERKRVSIDKTDPDHSLDVNGDGKFSTNLIVGGTLDVTGNTTLAGERLHFTNDAALIRLSDNQAAALTIENHDGTAGEFVVFGTQNAGLSLTTKQPHQHNNTLTIGVDDAGYDVKLFGDTASAFMLWDTSADDLILSGAAGLVVPEGQLTIGATAVTTSAAELNHVDGVTSAIQTQLDTKAALAGPTFTGTPAAPTAAQSTNTTQVATTAFVQSNLTAALLRTALGITTNSGDPSDSRGLYFDSSNNKYLISS